jgi:hypothetical protein
VGFLLCGRSLVASESARSAPVRIDIENLFSSGRSESGLSHEKRLTSPGLSIGLAGLQTIMP